MPGDEHDAEGHGGEHGGGHGKKDHKEHKVSEKDIESMYFKPGKAHEKYLTLHKKNDINYEKPIDEKTDALLKAWDTLFSKRAMKQAETLHTRHTNHLHEYMSDYFIEAFDGKTNLHHLRGKELKAAAEKVADKMIDSVLVNYYMHQGLKPKKIAELLNSFSEVPSLREAQADRILSNLTQGRIGGRQYLVKSLTKMLKSNSFDITDSERTKKLYEGMTSYIDPHNERRAKISTELQEDYRRPDVLAYANPHLTKLKLPEPKLNQFEPGAQLEDILGFVRYLRDEKPKALADEVIEDNYNLFKNIPSYAPKEEKEEALRLVKGGKHGKAGHKGEHEHLDAMPKAA